MFALCYDAVEYNCIMIPIHNGVLDKPVHDLALFVIAILPNINLIAF